MENEIKTNEANKTLAKKIWLICAGVFVLLAAGLLLTRILFQKKPVSDLPVSDLAKTRAYLLGRSVLKFSEISEAQSISISQIPQELQIFILTNSDISNLVTQETEYKNQSQGFNISYDVKGAKLEDLYSSSLKLAFQKKWEVLRGERANQFAVLEARYSKYDIRISLTLQQDKINYLLEAISTK